MDILKNCWKIETRRGFLARGGFLPRQEAPFQQDDFYRPVSNPLRRYDSRRHPLGGGGIKITRLFTI
jgi:hypothetical protein